MDFKTLENYWFVLCESKDVKQKPSSFKLLDKPVVVYRNGQGEALAFIDKCPHRNVPVSEGQIINGNLQCPFHGWEFNHEGTCVKVPGLMADKQVKAAKLKKFQVLEQAGYIWICLKANSDKKPHLPAHLNDDSLVTTSYRTHLKCGSLDIAENFLDPFHTPFVHAGIIRTESKRFRNQIKPFHIESGLEVHYTKDKPQSGFISLFGRAVDRDLGRFLMPGIIELEYYSQDKIEFVNTMYITPRSQTESSIYFKASLRPTLIPPSLIYAIAGFAIKVALKQDRVILEKQTEVVSNNGGAAFCHTELDIVRKQLENLYAGNGLQVEFKALEAMI